MKLRMSWGRHCCCFRCDHWCCITMVRSIISNRCLNRSLNNSRCYRWLVVISLLGSIIICWWKGKWNCISHWFLFSTDDFNVIMIFNIRCWGNIWSQCWDRSNIWNWCWGNIWSRFWVWSNCIRHRGLGEICGSYFETFSVRDIVDCLKNTISINIAVCALHNSIRCPYFLFWGISCGITIIVST